MKKLKNKIFVIDIGNTQIKFAEVSDNFSVTKIKTCQTNNSISKIKNIIVEFIARETIEKIAIASVVSNIEQKILEFIKQKFPKLKITQLNYSSFSKKYKSNLNTKKCKPGADRLANAVFAIEKYECPTCIVDIGSAVTMEVIDSKKTFIGGVIFPGIKLQLESLQKKTSQLKNIKLQANHKAIGNSTDNAITAGIVLGITAAIEGLLQKINSELNEDLKNIIITGGDGKLFLKHLSKFKKIIFDEHFTIKGIAYFAKNK